MLKTTKLVVPAALVMCALGVFMLAVGVRQSAQPVSVATVDLEKAFANLAERSAKEAELKERKAQAQKKLAEMEDQVKKLTADIGIMGDGPDRKAKLLERARLAINARNEKDISEQILMMDEVEVLRDLYNKIDAAATAIAIQRGINLVFVNDDKLTIPDGASRNEFQQAVSMKKMLYADPALDITADVVTAMNNNFNANVPAGGGAKPAPAAPAPAPAGKK